MGTDDSRGTGLNQFLGKLALIGSGLRVHFLSPVKGMDYKYRTSIADERGDFGFEGNRVEGSVTKLI